MIERSIIVSFFILAMSGLAKAGMRLAILAVVGLGGMYLMHLLAQDFQKIRNGRSVHSVMRRSIHETEIPSDFELSDVDIGNTTSKSLLKDIEIAEERIKMNQILTLDRILQFDPTGCARRYVCTIGAKSYKKRTRSEKNIIHLLRNVPKGKPDSGQEAFNFALNLGMKKKDATACAEEYPKCLFTVSQMMKLVGFL